MALTDTGISRMKAASIGKRYERFDRLVPCFGVRVTDKGVKSYIFLYSFHGERRRYTIGRYGEISLEDAREEARKLRGMVRRERRDPAAEQKAARPAVDRMTFAKAAELYDKRVLSGQRSGHATRLAIAKHVLPHWKDRPVDAITDAEVLERIEALLDDEKRAGAHKLYDIIRNFFGWAVSRPDVPVKENPCRNLKPQKLIGKKVKRDRVLTDDELRALHRAALSLGHPWDSIVRLLMLAGLRRSEVAAARHAEIDFAAGTWTIPASRMKSGVAHTVPITKEIGKILKSLPRTSEFLFPGARGDRPVSGWSAFKNRLDREMHSESAWCFHDIRRTFRTQISSLPIPEGDVVRELLLAHAQPGLHQVYDLHRYDAEKRRGLELWAERLAAILENRTAMVTPIRAPSVA